MNATGAITSTGLSLPTVLAMPQPSASLNTSVNNGPVLLPLFKLSYSTAATTGSNMLWTHLPNRDDMYAIFDVVRRVDPGGSVVEKKILKLIRGGDLMVCREYPIAHSLD